MTPRHLFHAHSADSSLSNKQRTRLLHGSIFLVLAATLSACGAPNQAESQPAVSTSPEGQAQTADSSSTQAASTQTTGQTTTPFSQTNQPASHLLQGVSATVYKDANCGCCTEWIDYAGKAGLTSTYQHPPSLSALKDRYEVPQQMRSCHTTVTSDGYVFEGHIPAKFMAQFLDNPPSDAIGLAVPSMPVGSPGMEYEGKFMAYNVFQLNKDGSYDIYAAVDTPEQQL